MSETPQPEASGQAALIDEIRSLLADGYSDGNGLRDVDPYSRTVLERALTALSASPAPEGQALVERLRDAACDARLSMKPVSLLTEAADALSTASPAPASPPDQGLRDLAEWVDKSDCCYGGSCIAYEVQTRLEAIIKCRV